MFAKPSVSFAISVVFWSILILSTVFSYLLLGVLRIKEEYTLYTKLPFLLVILMGVAILIDSYRTFRDCRCNLVTKSVPSHFLTNMFLVLMGLFYFTKILRFFLTVGIFATTKNAQPPEICPVQGSDPNLVSIFTTVAYLNAFLSALSQIALLCVLNMLLNI